MCLLPSLAGTCQGSELLQDLVAPVACLRLQTWVREFSPALSHAQCLMWHHALQHYSYPTSYRSISA